MNISGISVVALAAALPVVINLFVTVSSLVKRGSKRHAEDENSMMADLRNGSSVEIKLGNGISVTMNNKTNGIDEKSLENLKDVLTKLAANPTPKADGSKENLEGKELRAR